MPDKDLLKSMIRKGEMMLSGLSYDEVIKRNLVCFDFSSVSDLPLKVQSAYSDKADDFPIIQYSPAERLVVLNLLLGKCYEQYAAFDVSDEIIIHTFDDVALHANQYYIKHGKIGLSEDDVIWFRHIVHMEIFKLGVIQFQPFRMVYLDRETLGEDYMSFSDNQKEYLPAGTPVINCHIQKGQKLSKAAIKRSFSLAERFFGSHYPCQNFRTFLCYSWLLKPAMVQNMDRNSNIHYFFDMFEVISQCSDTAQAEENLLTGTSLYDMYVKHKEWFGYGCGIRKIKGCVSVGC